MEFVFYWFEQESGLSRQAVAAVDRCLDDALHRDALLHEMGLMHDIHDDNPALREQAGKVTSSRLPSITRPTRINSPVSSACGDAIYG